MKSELKYNLTNDKKGEIFRNFLRLRGLKKYGTAYNISKIY